MLRSTGSHPFVMPRRLYQMDRPRVRKLRARCRLPVSREPAPRHFRFSSTFPSPPPGRPARRHRRQKCRPSSVLAHRPRRTSPGSEMSSSRAGGGSRPVDSGRLEELEGLIDKSCRLPSLSLWQQRSSRIGEICSHVRRHDSRLLLREIQREPGRGVSDERALLRRL